MTVLFECIILHTIPQLENANQSPQAIKKAAE